jgi:hypothetical protein
MNQRYFSSNNNINENSSVSKEKQSPPQKEIKITKYIIHSYPFEKDSSPATLEIEKNSGKINTITKHDPVSIKSFKSKISNGFWDTFLPAGYPNSVGDGYLKFTMYSNISALAITAMSFLST